MNLSKVSKIYGLPENSGLSRSGLIDEFYKAALEMYEDGDCDLDDMRGWISDMEAKEFYEAAEGVKTAITVIKFIENV